MYNEKDFKDHIKHLKARRILYMLIFSIIGSALGVIISDYIVDILLFNQIWRVIIISISTLFFFWVSTVMTSNTEKDVQDGYWKLEVMKNLNSISEKLDNPVEIKKLASVIEGESISEIESTNISDLQETTIVETLQDASSTPEILETKTEEIIDEAPKKSADLESESTVANVDDVINSLPLLDFIDEPEEKVLEKQK